jgi:hypothetical protein
LLTKFKEVFCCLMRLDLLLQREDFSRIFPQLLQNELSKRFGWSGKISWRDSRCSSSLHLLVNHKLNVIYPASMKRSVLRQLTAEYGYHPNLLRRLLQLLFVRFATSFPFEYFTTIAVVKIEPWLDELENWCVIPGNHSIRVVEFDSNLCRVYQKPGFNRKFILNEIAIREQFPFLPIPKLLDSDKDEGWYMEERIRALPLNRIADNSVCEDMLSQAQCALLDLYEPTKKFQRLNEYRQQLNSSLQQAVDLLPAIYQQSDHSQLTSTIEKLCIVLDCSDTLYVNTVMSHGDFQPANILVTTTDSNEKILYLIDWEYSERRSQFYDALVFATKSRFPCGLAERIKLLMTGKFGNHFSWCGYTVLTDWMVALFLLEDILVRLEELYIPGLRQKSEGLRKWMYEVDKMHWLFDR